MLVMTKRASTTTTVRPELWSSLASRMTPEAGRLQWTAASSRRCCYSVWLFVHIKKHNCKIFLVISSDEGGCHSGGDKGEDDSQWPLLHHLFHYIRWRSFTFSHHPLHREGSVSQQWASTVVETRWGRTCNGSLLQLEIGRRGRGNSWSMDTLSLNSIHMRWSRFICCFVYIVYTYKLNFVVLV